MTGKAKLVWVMCLFAAALAILAVAAVTHALLPLFVMWIPLVATPWVITRPERHSLQDHRAQQAETPGVQALDDERES